MWSLHEQKKMLASVSTLLDDDANEVVRDKVIVYVLSALFTVNHSLKD